MNRNVADYTNFDGKTNKRIVQGPGGASSLSLAWGDSGNDYSNNHKQSNQRSNNYGQQLNDTYGQKHGNTVNREQQSYDQPINAMGNNYDKSSMNNRNTYDEQNNRQTNSNNIANNNNPIGGQHGYNSYNLITNQPNSYQNYPPTSKYPPQTKSFQQKNDPSFYKPSTSTSYKNNQQEELDRALQQEKHKIQSSRGKRGQNQPTSNILYQQSNNESKPCVKFLPQKTNDIFGSHYDYWKQDGHNTNKNSGANIQKETPYLHERNNQHGNQNRGYDQQGPFDGNVNNQKTSTKVHIPPGGKSNFTFG